MESLGVCECVYLLDDFGLLFLKIFGLGVRDQMGTPQQYLSSSQEVLF